MLILGTITEYNPLHLGHIKQLRYMKEELKADKIICLMSGNFTQRGEPAVLDKYKRAKHAILSGADMVIELPTVFATANAEIFAKGAINIFDSINVINGICFGAESGKKEDFLNLAKAFNNESKEFKKAVKENLEQGFSLAKSKFNALKSLNSNDYNEMLISSPNNILGLEYTKAILERESKIDIFPLYREDSHNDINLRKGITSATSIREVIKTGKLKKIKKYVPYYVYKDLDSYPTSFDKMIMAEAIKSSEQELKEVLDCTEGLENRIKALLKDNLLLEDFVEKAYTKRYTKARIRRILLSNFLGIKKDFVLECIKSELYAKVLAVKSESKDLITEISNKSSIPIITRKSDVLELTKTAKTCFNKDVLANDLYNLATLNKENEYQMLII